MITLFYSAEPELARRSALKILKKEYPVRDEMNYLSFNMAVTGLRELLDEVENPPFGIEKKAVLAENCAFLAKPVKTKGAKSKIEKGSEALLDRFAAYCLNPNLNVDLFLVVYAKELDKDNPVVQAVIKTGKLCPLELPSASQWVDFAKRYFDRQGCPASLEAAEEIVKRVDGDYGRFLQELAKLSAYANKEPLSLAAVKTLVSPKIEDNTFEMSNALLAGDIAKAIRVYRDLKLHSVDEVRLLNQLATQFKFLDEVKFLRDKGLNESEIASELKENPYRVKIGLRNIYRCSEEALPRILEEIYRAEKSILSGESSQEFAFLCFLGNFYLR